MTQKLACFDLDGTFFRWQLYHELVFELKDTAKVFNDETAAALDQALIAWQSKQQTWRDYEMQVVSAFEPIVGSLDPAIFDRSAAAVVSRSGHKVYNYTKNLLDRLKQEDYFTLAISGSQQEIIEPFTEQYGFDACIGALYERVDGRFTGTVARYVPGRKHEIINDFLQAHPTITLDGSVAVGDSEGDISMLEMVEHPIAFNPSSGLLDTATSRGWEVVIERKNIAYTLAKDNNGQYLLEKTDSF